MANLFRVALDHLDGDPHPAVPGTMLDHPEVAPVGLGLRGPGPSTSTRIFRHPSPGLDHRFPIASLPIAGCDRWRIRMPTGLERSHPSGGAFILLLPNGSSCPQPRVDVDDGSPPGGASLFLFRDAPPLYQHDRGRPLVSRPIAHRRPSGENRIR